MKTIGQILKKAKPGDTLIAGKRKWVVTDYMDYNIALPANKFTTFELWDCGLEKVVTLPGLKLVRKAK